MYSWNLVFAKLHSIQPWIRRYVCLKCLMFRRLEFVDIKCFAFELAWAKRTRTDLPVQREAIWEKLILNSNVSERENCLALFSARPTQTRALYFDHSNWLGSSWSFVFMSFALNTVSTWSIIESWYQALTRRWSLRWQWYARWVVFNGHGFHGMTGETWNE